MNTPENSEQCQDNAGSARILGASAWEHTNIRLDKTEYYEDSAQYYAQMFESCRATLAAGGRLSERRYIELLEARVREAQGEYADMNDFHVRRAARERAEVNNFLEAVRR
ncbi:hypothetical protein F4X86_00515 [Candidatus Saccharibacteria bacterium]|nr:hypothetical protein [Candidatus Saccharibacteria bacterium]